MTRSEMQGDRFIGYLFEPVGSGPHPAVGVIPGTTGAQAMEPTAALLASHGYAAMVIGYMGLVGLPKSLCEIPLEALEAGIQQLSMHPAVDSSRVGVVCALVGVTGALAALSKIDHLNVLAVVALSPSNVIWQGLAEGRLPQKSSWTLAGVPLPYLPIHGERLLPELVQNVLLKGLLHHPRPRALHLLSAYSTSLRDRTAVEKAAIHTEQIAAPILFLSGDDDQMWPGREMADALLHQRTAAGRLGDRHCSFAAAGHIIRPPIIPTTVTWTERMYSGGTPEGCARANTAAWAEILQFLAKHLS